MNNYEEPILRFKYINEIKKKNKELEESRKIIKILMEELRRYERIIKKNNITL